MLGIKANGAFCHPGVEPHCARGHRHQTPRDDASSPHGRNHGETHPGPASHGLSLSLAPAAVALAVCVFFCCTTLAQEAGKSGSATKSADKTGDSMATGRSSEDRGEAKPDGVYEVRQGGYVEKVDPSIDYKDRLPRIPPRKPGDSLDAMHIVDPFRVELVAAEPLVCDPVDLAFDENGRLFVVEMITYSERGHTKTGRVSVLTDEDGDGRMDRSTVYADGLTWPTGVLCYDGGILVASAPHLWYFKDTDGDDKADVRELWVTGFETSNPNALPNSLRWGLDSRIHGMSSTAGGKLRAVKWEEGGADRTFEPIECRGRDFSIDPTTGWLELESGGSQFGLTFDDWGRKFESSNSAPIEMVMYEDRYIARNPFLVAPAARVRIWVDGMNVFRTSPVEPWRVIRTEMRVKGVFSGPVEGGGTPAGYFTAACGVMLYTGDAYPEQYRGTAFVCEGAGNLVHHMRLEPDGVGFTAHRTLEEREFLNSDEVWFRPIHFTHGPDGLLYLADMYREVYEHPDAIPPSVKKYLDINNGNDRGRIYRFVPEGFRQPKPVRLGHMATAELVDLLAHTNRWHRRTASRLLFERQDPAAVAPLRHMAEACSSPPGRMHALYALAGQKALTPADILPRLDDPRAEVREHAVKLAERLLGKSPAIREKLYGMVEDPAIRVRYQLAFTLGEIDSDKATAALAAVAGRDSADRWLRLAVLSSSLHRAGDLLAILTKNDAARSATGSAKLLDRLAQQVGLEARSDQVAEVLAAVEALPAGERALAQRIVGGLSRGLEQAGSPLRSKLGRGGSGLAGQLVEEIIAEAKRRATNVAVKPARRAEAVRSLALASFDEAADVLEELLDSRQPQEVQRAAIQALSRFRHDDVTEMILYAWPGFSPQVRGEAAEALFARTERLGALLDAVEEGVILPSQLDPARIEFLISHPEEGIAARAKELLGGAKLARREDVVADYRKALDIDGDVERGRAVFKKECATCHRLEGVGYDLGLPLTSIQNRGPEAILLNVLDPNREVNPQYLNYIVLTDDGLTVTGMIDSETATSLTLRRAEGESDTVLRTQIDQLQNTGLSIMPEGLEEQLTLQQMADVIAYLMSIQ